MHSDLTKLPGEPPGPGAGDDKTQQAGRIGVGRGARAPILGPFTGWAWTLYITGHVITPAGSHTPWGPLPPGSKGVRRVQPPLQQWQEEKQGRGAECSDEVARR